MSAVEANRMLWRKQVPETATDVWFISSYMSTSIDCKLKQDEFLAWCSKEGWKPTAILAREPEYMHSDRLGDVVKIESGFRFDDIEGDLGYWGLYDATTGRTYVFFSGR